MKNSYKLGLAAIAASLALVGCGGGSSSSITESVTGQFVDGYVAGLNYTCDPSGNIGVTNNMGEYTCNVGDTVTFSLGVYVLGSATASSGIVTPYDIQPDDENASINVARLLQTLDADESDDIITIPADFTALDNSTVELNATFSDFEAGMIEDLTSIGITDLIGAEAAQNTMDGDILTALLTGKTFYNVGSHSNGANWIDSIVFNTDATSLEWTSLTSAESGTDSVVIEGNTIVLSSVYGTFELVFVEATADKLVFHSLDTNGAVVEEDFMFFKQSEAQAYYDSLQPVPTEPTTTAITQSMLDGKTFYHYENEVQYSEEIYAKMTLSGGTLTRTEVINGGAPDTFTVPYQIIDGKVRVDVPAMDGDPSEYIWWTLLSETADSWTMKDEDDQGQDGTIDYTNKLTVYLSKPTGYPDFTANTTSVDTTTGGGTSTTPIDTTGNATQAELSNNTSISIFHNITPEAMSQMSDTLYTTDLYTNQKEIVDAGNLSCSDLGDFVLINTTDMTANGFIGESYISQSDSTKSCEETTYVDTSLLFYGSYTYASSYTVNFSF
jgi:hypothetical protein